MFTAASGGDELLAEIFKEFRDGLPERLEQIRSSLEALGGEGDAEAAEIFYRTAHSLKGTAPSFGAHELVAPATALAEIGRSWFEGDVVEPAMLAAASEELARLEDAAGKYISDMEGETVG